MKSTAFRRACILLAFFSPLVVTSCTSTITPSSPEALRTEQCAACVSFGVYAWHFTPSKGQSIEELLQVPDHSGIPSLSSGMLRIVKPEHVNEIPTLLRKAGRANLITYYSGVTVAGEPLPISVINSSEELHALLTSGPELKDTESRVIKFELSTELTQGVKPASENKSFSSGRILLPTGGALLNIQQVNDSYVVWLIQARS